MPSDSSPRSRRRNPLALRLSPYSRAIAPALPLYPARRRPCVLLPSMIDSSLCPAANSLASASFKSGQSIASGVPSQRARATASPSAEGQGCRARAYLDHGVPESIFLHHLSQPHSIRRPARVDDGADIVEVLRPDVRRHDDQCAHRSVGLVDEVMCRAPRRRHPVARLEVARYPVDGIAQRAFQDVDALLVVVWLCGGGTMAPAGTVISNTPNPPFSAPSTR